MDVSELKLKFSASGVESTRRDVRSLDDSVQGVVERTNKMGQAFATAGGFIIAQAGQFIATRVVSGIQGMISAASDMNETVSKVNVVFGDSAKEILAWSNSSARSFGMSKQQALDTASTYGAMAMAAGVGGSAAVKFGEDLVGAAADLGSFWNFDPAQVAADIRSGLAGESEPLRKYNIFLTEASVKAQALKMGLIGSNGELSEENKVLARQAYIMEHLGPAAGDYLRTQSGLANATRTLKAHFATLQIFLGGKIVPTLAKVVSGVNTFIARIQRLQSKGLSPMQAVLKAIRIQIYKTFGRGALDVVNAIAHAIVWGFNKARDAINAVTGEIGKWVKVMGWAFSDGLKVSSLMYAFPKPLREVARGFLLIADAVGDAFHAFQSGGFSGLLDQLPDTLGRIWDGLKVLGGQLVGVALDLVDWTVNVGMPKLGGWLTDIGNDLWSWVKSRLGLESVTGDGTGGPDTDREIGIGRVLITGVVELSGALSDISAEIERLLALQRTPAQLEAARKSGEDTGKAFADKIQEGLAAGMEGGDDGGDDGGGGWWSAVKKILVWEPSIFRDDQATFLDEWFAWAQGLGIGMREGFIDGIESSIGDATLWALTLVDHGVALFAGLAAGALGEWNKFTSWLSWRGSWAVLAVGDLIDTLYQSGKDLLQGIKDGAVEIWDGFVSWLKDRPGFALTELTNMDLLVTLFGAGQLMMTGFWNGLKDIWNQIAGWFSSLPDWAKKLKGPPARDAKALIGNGVLMMQGFGKGLAIGWAGIERQLSGYTASVDGSSRIGMTVPGLRNSGFAGAGASAGGATYIFQNSIVGGDIERFIEAKVASGQAKRIDRTISSRRLQESY